MSLNVEHLVHIKGTDYSKLNKQKKTHSKKIHWEERNWENEKDKNEIVTEIEYTL